MRDPSRPTDAVVSAMKAINGDLLILGAGGKMGPSLANLARRGAVMAGSPRRIVAVSRFRNGHLRAELSEHGVETIACDMLEPGALSRLPEIPNVIFMAARKFGTSGEEQLTWATNTYLPGLVAERFRRCRIVVFSTGNVYPLRSLSEGGAVETTPVEPVGEYAQSALGRYYSEENLSEKALAQAKAALKLAPKDPIVLANVSETYEALGNRKAALQYAHETLKNGATLANLQTRYGLQNLVTDKSFRESEKQ